MVEILGSRLPSFTLEEKKLMQSKLDFIGINHYASNYVKDCMFSSCDLNGYDFDALLLKTGYRNGILIGDPVCVPQLSFVFPYTHTHIHNNLTESILPCRPLCLHVMLFPVESKIWSCISRKDIKTFLCTSQKMVSNIQHLEVENECIH